MPDPVVIITRPVAQAVPLAQGVAALGREAVVFPLLEIHPLADVAPLRAALNDLRSYAMVAFVSPNAIDATFALMKNWPRQVAIAIMGEGSRAALARHGVTPVDATIVSPRDPRTDSETLLQALDLDALRGKRVLVIRGETGRELLADGLRAAGVEVEQVAAYRRAAPSFTQVRRAQLAGLLQATNDWIVTSSEALHILADMTRQLEDTGCVVKLQQQNLLVPHARIAETARALGFRHVTLTGSGDEQLLAALQSRA